MATASANGQTRGSTIRLSVSSTDFVTIDIQGSVPRKSWSFLTNYGSAMNLGNRIYDFQARGTGAESIAVRNVAPGEFRADEISQVVSYKVRLTVPDARDVAHVSWLTPQNGLLMFADLLPREMERPILADFKLPDAWTLETAVTQDKNRFVVDDSAKAVFLVGRPLRAIFRTVEGMNVDFAFSGDWSFKEDHVAKSASSLLKKYFELTGFRLPKESMILIAPIPSANSDVRWTAETRGSTVILLLDPRAPFRNWVAQLEVILTHELFHLWVPNSLSLKGDYDWFFEGFTLYLALLTARESNLISFQELLNTLARVYDSYRSSPELVSLIEASERRWTASNSAIYDKGMLVAFLYDLMLREESGGKTRLSQKYRQLFSKYSSKSTNGNEAIMSLLKSSSATDEFLKSHVEGRSILNLEQSLMRYGFLIDMKEARTHLSVADSPSQDQLRLLRSLGYKR